MGVCVCHVHILHTHTHAPRTHARTNTHTHTHTHAHTRTHTLTHTHTHTHTMAGFQMTLTACQVEAGGQAAGEGATCSEEGSKMLVQDAPFAWHPPTQRYRSLSVVCFSFFSVSALLTSFLGVFFPAYGVFFFFFSRSNRVGNVCM